VAIAMATLCAGASAALQPFTFNPAAAGLAGASFDADNILISDYSTVLLSGSTFSETGYLSVSAFQTGGTTIIPTGLNSTWGMYIKFDGLGTTTSPTTGTFTSLDYTLYGYNGSAVFGFSGNTPTESATLEVALASGSLIYGSTSSTGSGPTFTPSANANLTFDTSGAPVGFFANPKPFYNLAITAFTNTSSEVETFIGGFRIRQGGGSINFATSPIPEPDTYALMLGGLAAAGFVARRRRA
jgi:hypothetical protein